MGKKKGRGSQFPADETSKRDTQSTLCGFDERQGRGKSSGWTGEKVCVSRDFEEGERVVFLDHVKNHTLLKEDERHSAGRRLGQPLRRVPEEARSGEERGKGGGGNQSRIDRPFQPEG